MQHNVAEIALGGFAMGYNADLFLAWGINMCRCVRSTPYLKTKS